MCRCFYGPSSITPDLHSSANSAVTRAVRMPVLREQPIICVWEGVDQHTADRMYMFVPGHLLLPSDFSTPFSRMCKNPLIIQHKLFCRWARKMYKVETSQLNKIWSTVGKKIIHTLAPSLWWILTGLPFETCLHFPKFLLHGQADISGLYEVHLCMFT